MRLVFSNIKSIIIAAIFFVILLTIITAVASIFLNVPDMFTIIKKIFLKW